MWENLLLQAQASDSELQDQEEILEQDVMSDQMQEDIEEMFEQDALMPSETQEQEFGLSDVQAILEEQGLYKEPGVSEQSSKKKKNKNGQLRL